MLSEIIKRGEDLDMHLMRDGIVGSNTHRKPSPDDFSGIALADKYAPLFFLNGADSRYAQMLTLANKPGISGRVAQSLDDLSTAAMPDDSSERWCHEMAAEHLLLLATLREIVGMA